MCYSQMLRIYQERELLIRIRARINQQNSIETEEIDDDSSNHTLERVDFSKPHAKKLTSTFVEERLASDPGAKHFVRELRTFLYQEVGEFGGAFHFRERDLPRLEGTVVRIAYEPIQFAVTDSILLLK